MYDGSCHIYVICVCLRIAVSSTYCVVFIGVLVFVLCLEHGGVQHLLCYVFCFICLVSCVPNFASFSGLSIYLTFMSDCRCHIYLNAIKSRKYMVLFTIIKHQTKESCRMYDPSFNIHNRY